MIIFNIGKTNFGYKKEIITKILFFRFTFLFPIKNETEFRKTGCGSIFLKKSFNLLGNKKILIFLLF